MKQAVIEPREVEVAPTVVVDAAPAPAPDESAPWHVRLRHWMRTPNDRYTVGTLKYSGMGLIVMSVWLLWGDFVYTLLDASLGELLPKLLKDLGASDTANSILNKSFAYAVAFLVAPIVSFRSDRTRTRWGRRIPYLIWSTPFVGLFLVLIGYHEALAELVTGGAERVRLLGMTFGRVSVHIAIFGLLILGWDFANIFVNTVYWYLFNDVVPQAYMSRFLAFFRIVGTLAGIGFKLWIFPHALTHTRVIFVTAGIAYTAGFLLMCLFLREGEYPPPPENIVKPDELRLRPRRSRLGRLFNAVAGQMLRIGFIRRVISSCITFGGECFTHRLYWFLFLASCCGALQGMCFTFVLVRNTNSLGLTMAELGRLGSWILGVSLLLQFPAGWISDRWSPLRVNLAAQALGIIGSLAGCVFIFRDFGHDGNLRYLYFTSLAFMPIGIVGYASELPMYMRLLPRDRFGQFSAANAMIRSFAMIFGAIAAGQFMDGLDRYFHLGDWRYRFIPAWTLVFQIPTVLFLLLVYRQWKRLGGDACYTPPVPGRRADSDDHELSPAPETAR